MPKESDMIECPNCGRLILDTGGPFVVCRFCGKQITRAELDKQDAEVASQMLMIDLQHDVERLKFIKNIAFAVGAVCLAVPFILLAAVTHKNWLLIGGTALPAVLWLSAGVIYSKRMEVKKSKLFDMIGHRDIDL